MAVLSERGQIRAFWREVVGRASDLEGQRLQEGVLR